LLFYRSLLLIVVMMLEALTAAAAPIRLRTRTLDPEGDTPEYSARQMARRPSHLLLQFDGRPGDEVIAELARRGIRVLRRIPDDAVMAVAKDGWNLEGLPVRWAGPLTVADKMSPEVGTGAVSAYLIIFHPDVPSEAARGIVEAAGLLVLAHPNLLAGQVLASGPLDRVQDLAARDEVAYVLPASPDLLAGNPVIACAGPLEDGETVAEYVKVGRGWPQIGGTVELKYAVTALTGRLAESTIRTEVARALEEWAKYANLRFVAGGDTTSARTLAIRFARASHGDSYPFDGTGKVLAHTFYPASPNAEPAAGDIHLDDDENWGSGLDLYSVVLHEAGHALGLGHSDKPGTVMYPYYRLATVLTSDDIAGIRDLYGTEQTSARTPSSTNPPVVTPPSTNPEPANPPTGTNDRTPPMMRISSPAFTMLSTSLASITLRGTASDNVGVTAVNWSTSGGASGQARGIGAWSAPDIPLLTGNNTITVKVVDAAGNTTWRAVTVVRR
jgi:hypothetical protein